jgi:hypothetical protein
MKRISSNSQLLQFSSTDLSFILDVSSVLQIPHSPSPVSLISLGNKSNSLPTHIQWLHYNEVASAFLFFGFFHLQICWVCLHSFRTFISICVNSGPLLWSGGHSSWLQIQRSGFDSRRYQIFWEVVGLERDPLSLVSEIVKLLEKTSSGYGLEIREYGRADPSR